MRGARVQDRIWLLRGHVARRLRPRGLRVNVGCGEFPAPGWLNIDLHRDGPNPSVLASATELPLADGSADAIYAGHFLEHLTEDDVADVLVEFRRVLRRGGQLCIVGPDLDRAERRFPEMVDVIRFGERRWPGDTHMWESRETRVVDMVRSAGFGKVGTPLAVALPRRAWPVASPVAWQFAVVAEAP